MNPFFSIVIPTFNRASLIEETIRRILCQTIIDFEVIVVDDGSEDSTNEIVGNIKDNRLVYKKIKNGERGRARNIGAQIAKGRYINFFDSDDIFLIDLAFVQRFIIKNRFPPVVYGSLEIESKEGIYSPNKPYKGFTENLLFDNFLACGSVFLKKEIAVKFPFREDRDLSSAEDWELWLRLNSKHEFLDCGETIFKIVQHSSRSISNISTLKVEKRDNLFAQIVNSSTYFKESYGKRAANLFMADRYTFIALSFIEDRNVKKAFNYLIKSIKASGGVAKRKRFWAVLKKISLLSIS